MPSATPDLGATVEPVGEEGPVATDDDRAAPCDGVSGVDAMQARADAYFAGGNAKAGVTCLEEAVADDPQAPAVRQALVKHVLALGDGKKARVYADELVRQRPLDIEARELLGRALMQQHMWREAIDDYTLVVKSEPDNIFAHNNIGYSALQIGALEVAREHLEDCLSLSPQRGFMLNNLGVTYERLGRLAEAHAAFSRAAELSPKYLQARLNRDRVQGGLTQDQRIVSTETLLHMREPALAGAVDAVPEPVGAGDALDLDVPTAGSPTSMGGAAPRMNAATGPLQ
ncbi:MAG TPA: tetratricopeptide repeat protein [Myxococcota bacterium]